MNGDTLLAGRRGLVLGVSDPTSLGWRCAEAAVARGASVAVTCRPARLAAVQDAIGRIGITEVYAVDVRDEGSMETAFEAVGGPLDFLIHTPMYVPAATLRRPLTELDLETFSVVNEVGVYSLVAACRYALPALRASLSARVVTFSSEGSRRAFPGYHAAGMAKACLEAAVRYLAVELGAEGISINTVSPSLIETAGAVRTIGDSRAAATSAWLAKRAPTRRATSGEDVGRAVAWLCSEDAGNMTGEIIRLDGGLSHLYF